MNLDLLVLYTRSGCCLCKGLEERLQNVPLNELNPPMALQVVDIDKGGISEIERARYDQRVPVMVVVLNKAKRTIELPRVSPRIKEQDFFRWMQKAINKILPSN